jgi:thioredoxin-like negative regulator of GroEL
MPLYYQLKPLTDSNFDAFMKGYNGPVLAEFWAPWCPHCRAFESTVKKVAGILAGTAAVVQVNTRDNPALAGRFDVRSIPVLFLLKHGRTIDQISGAQDSEAIISWFRRHK